MRNTTKKTAQDGSISYLIRVSAGYALDGTQIKKSMTWKPSQGMTPRQIERELEHQCVMFEEKVKNGFALDGNIRFSDYAERFMSVKELSLKCRVEYEGLLVRINQGIGHIRLDKLQPMHLQELYKELRTIKSRRTGEGLSDKTILHHHRLISSILSQACKERLIERNIASRDFMDAPKVKRKEPAYLDDIQAREVVELLHSYDDIRVKTSVLLLIYTGMRRGELCGMEWGDIDYTNSVIHIRRATQYIRDKGLITKEPKNESSIRSLKVPLEVLNLLADYRQWQLAQQQLCGDKWQESITAWFVDGSSSKLQTVANSRIFTTEDGGLISPDTINFWIEKLRERYNLPQFTPHSLRHTNITLQIAAGVSIRTIANRAGHSQASTTTNIYAHAIKTADEIASQALDDMLTPRKRKA